MFWAPFPDWRKIRSVAISMLRDEGMGKARLEPQILEEIKEFLHHFIDGHVGEPIYIADGLQLASSNLVSQMIFGKRFSYEDPSIQRIVKGIRDAFFVISRLSLLSNVPFAGLLRRSLEKRMNYFIHRDSRPFCIRHFKEHQATFDPDHPRDIIDRYKLKLMKSTSEEDRRCFSGKLLQHWLILQNSKLILVK